MYSILKIQLLTSTTPAFFDGDLIESKLEKLNDDTDPEYQNWNTHEFSKLEYQIQINEIDDRIKRLASTAYLTNYF